MSSGGLKEFFIIFYSGRLREVVGDLCEAGPGWNGVQENWPNVRIEMFSIVI